MRFPFNRLLDQTHKISDTQRLISLAQTLRKKACEFGSVEALSISTSAKIQYITQYQTDIPLIALPIKPIPESHGDQFQSIFLMCDKELSDYKGYPVFQMLDGIFDRTDFTGQYHQINGLEKRSDMADDFYIKKSFKTYEFPGECMFSALRQIQSIVQKEFFGTIEEQAAA